MSEWLLGGRSGIQELERFSPSTLELLSYELLVLINENPDRKKDIDCKWLLSVMAGFIVVY